MKILKALQFMFTVKTIYLSDLISPKALITRLLCRGGGGNKGLKFSILGSFLFRIPIQKFQDFIVTTCCFRQFLLPMWLVKIINTTINLFTKYMKQLLFSLAACLFCFLPTSCSDKSPSSTDAIKVEFGNPISNFTQLIESVEYIPLETDSLHILGESPELIVSDSSFYMIDVMNSRVFRYSQDGLFLNRIGQKGNGESEYNSINGYQIDNDIVTIYSYPNKSLQYKINGEFLQEHITGDLGSYSYALPDGKTLTYYGYGAVSQFRAAILNPDNSIKRGFLSDGNSNRVMNFTSLAPPISNYRERLFLIDSFNPIVYEYKNLELLPYLKFDFGKYSVPDEYYTFSDIYEAAEFLFSQNYAILNRYSESSDIKLVEIILNKVEEGGIPYYGLYYKEKWLWFSFGKWEAPMSLAFRCFSEDGKLFFVLSPSSAEQLPQSLKKHVTNLSVMESLSDDSNYILAKFSLK